MTRFHFCLLSLLCFFVGASALSGVYGQGPQLTRAVTVWEYKILAVQRSSFDIEAELNRLGNAGWELVTVEPGHPSEQSLAQANKAYVEFGNQRSSTVELVSPTRYFLKRTKQSD